MELKCPFATEYGCNIGLEELRNKALALIKRLKIQSNSYRNKAQTQKGELARLYKQNAELKAEIEQWKETYKYVVSLM